MDRIFLSNLRKSIALILVAALVFTADMGFGYERAYADEGQEESVVSDNDLNDIAAEDVDETVSDESVSDESISDESESDESESDESDSDVSTFDEIESDGTVSDDSVSDDSVSDDSVSENVLSENSVSDDEVADDVDADCGERVKFTNETFISWLDAFLGDDYPAFRNIRAYNEDGSKDLENYGYIAKSEVDKIKSLTFQNDAPGKFYMGGYQHIDWSEIGKFSKLQELTIVEYYRTKVPWEIDEIDYPSTLRKLYIDGCTYNSKIDVSECKNLSVLKLVDVRMSSGKNTVVGINDEKSTLKKLTKLHIERTELDKIILPNDPTSSGLKLKVKSCLNTDTINLGGYKVVGDAMVSGCSSFTTLSLKGIATKEKNTLNLRSNPKLNNVNIDYYFSDENSELIIDTRINDAPSGDFSVSFAEGSKKGKIILKTEENSFFYEHGNLNKYDPEYPNNPYIFYQIIVESPEFSRVKFIIFAQERSKFEKKKLWLDSQSSYRRNYNADPVSMRIGEVMENNTPYFYTENGDMLSFKQSEYDVTVINKKITAGASDVIDVATNLTNLKTEGISPGEAEIKVETKGGSSISRKQKVIVFTPVEKLEFNVETLPPNHMENAGRWYFDMTLEFDENYVSVTDNINKVLPDFDMIIQKKNGDNWENYIVNTDGGVSVYDNHSIGIMDGNKITRKACIQIGRDCTYGEYRVKAFARSNYKYPYNNPTQYVETTNPKYFEFTVDAVAQSSNYMAYNAEVSETTLLGVYTSTVDFEAYDYGAGYTYSAEIVNSNKYKDCILLNQTGDRTFKLSYNPRKSSKEIAQMLKGLPSGNIIQVDFTIENESLGTTKTLKNDVGLRGFFSINYDLDGGVITPGNSYFYVLPLALNDMFSFTKVPVKNGYTFGGWYSNGTKVINPANEALGNVTLKANWIENIPVKSMKCKKSTTVKASGVPKKQVKKIKWKTTNKKVVAIKADKKTGKCKLTAKKKGEAIITATFNGKVVFKKKIVVK